VSTYLKLLVACCLNIGATACKSTEAPVSGQAVTTVSSRPSPEAVRIEATSEGFNPSSVLLGASRRLVFQRTSDRTCATAVSFPALGIEKELPLGKDVVVDIPAAAPSELTFQCGMAMYKGKIVAH
jgi:plastocyanin domain-containing protein